MNDFEYTKENENRLEKLVSVGKKNAIIYWGDIFQQKLQLKSQTDQELYLKEILLKHWNFFSPVL